MTFNILGHEYTEETVRFGLYKNGWVLALLEDRNMSNPNMDKIIQLTDCEIVKVIAENFCVVVGVLSETSHESTGKERMTQEIVNRMERIPLNPPFSVNLVPNIPTELVLVTRKSIFVTKDGQVMPFMDRLKPHLKRQVAALAGAFEYVVDLQIKQTVLPMASEYRTRPTT